MNVSMAVCAANLILRCQAHNETPKPQFMLDVFSAGRTIKPLNPYEYKVCSQSAVFFSVTDRVRHRHCDTACRVERTETTLFGS